MYSPTPESLAEICLLAPLSSPASRPFPQGAPRRVLLLSSLPSLRGCELQSRAVSARCSVSTGLPPGAAGTDVSAHRPCPPAPPAPVCPPALLQITRRSIYHVYVQTRCPAGLVCSHLWGSRGGLAVGCAYRLAFVFLFISRLVCLGGCFSPNTRRETIQSALKVSTQSRRRLCADAAWCSETPCRGPTPVSCEGGDLSRHPSGPWRCPGECPGLLCWSQDSGHKTGRGGGGGGHPISVYST